MKKIYTLLLVCSAFSMQLKAQTYFSQSFDGTTPPYTNFVNSTPTANLFDYALVSGTSTASTATNKLNLSRANGATGAIGFTRVASIGMPATTSVLQLSFDYNAYAVSGATGNSIGGNIIIGTPTSTDAGNGGVLPDAVSTMKLRFDTDNANGQFRLVNFKAPLATAGASPYYPLGTAIHVDAVFNTTSNTVSYDAPTTVASTGILAPGTINVYINGALIPGITAQPIVSPTLIPTGFKINLATLAQNIDLDNIIIKDAPNVGVVLPVDLLSFTGKSESNGISLRWTTASEQNSDYFEVLKLDETTQNFNAIAKVSAAGNSSDKRNYQYTDKNAKAGDNYYQLKQVDKDGTFKTYKEILVNNSLAEFKFQVSKSTDNSYQYKVFANSIETVELSILSVDGKVLSKNSVQLTSGYNSGALATSSLNSGLYLVRLKDAKNQVFVQKLLVSN